MRPLYIDWAQERAEMVAFLRIMGIRDERVLEAMSLVHREAFVPPDYRDGDLYGDHPSPIGLAQTISQPFIVAHMLEALSLQPGQRALEIGSGCGYVVAVMAAMGLKVYGVEIVPELHAHSVDALAGEGYAVQVRCGDGHEGWTEHAPYDAILVSCASPDVPPALEEQLAPGGRMILPRGGFLSQELFIVERDARGGLHYHPGLPVRFVPMR